MSAVPSPADVSAKSLDRLNVVIDGGDWSFCRNVYPEGETPIQDILAAMQSDPDFGNPLVQGGTFIARRDGKAILLARYEMDDFIEEPFGEIVEVTARYDDESEEVLSR